MVKKSKKKIRAQIAIQLKCPECSFVMRLIPIKPKWITVCANQHCKNDGKYFVVPSFELEEIDKSKINWKSKW